MFFTMSPLGCSKLVLAFTQSVLFHHIKQVLNVILSLPDIPKELHIHSYHLQDLLLFLLIDCTRSEIIIK